MTDTWAAKVLEGVPTWQFSIAGHADPTVFVIRNSALAAIARMGAGDGLVERLEGARKTFPLLGGGGVGIDWQLVQEHTGQARTNHGQTPDELARRGGLSWCELYAVLHDRKWQKMDSNDAMIACRALEARYLAALAKIKERSMGDTLRSLLAKAIDDLDAGKEVDLIELERQCVAAAIAKIKEPQT